MNTEQTYESIALETLLPRVGELRKQGWRLVQIGATPAADVVELNYSFDRDGHFLNLRLHLPAASARVPSITPVYWCAFAYENELHDLFRIQVDGIAVDFKGKFYKTTIPFPFGPRSQAAPSAPKPPAATPAPATPAQNA